MHNLKLNKNNKQLRLTQRQCFIITFICVTYFILFAIISNMYLSSYETQEKYSILNSKLNALHSYFNKFTNISFPISYSLTFYERYYELPTIYIITPTHNREAQIADLTRLRNTLWLVPKVFWIVVEDSSRKTRKIERFLDYTKLPYVHLNAETPDDLKVQDGDKPWTKPRGVFQRNEALKWLRDNSIKLDRGVVYFADDDNAYDIRLFEEMRYTNKVSVWPVAFVGELMYERPICNNGKVVDWFRIWGQKRPFPMDMAGFGVNLRLLLSHPSATFSPFSTVGMQESHFLSHLVRLEDLEAKADNCSKIYVWHTNTKKPLLAGEKLFSKYNVTYDQSILDEI